MAMPDTTWFAECGWGAFCHYLTGPETTAAEWNRRVESFDVGRLAEQLVEAGARFFFITLGQGSGHYCAPNETYDEITGIRPSKCSQRDLVSDLYESLSREGIELLAYVPADGSWADHEARKGLKMPVHWSDGVKHEWHNPEDWKKFRQPEFQSRWEQVCADWSRRFGGKVRGWWVDGAYAQPQRYPEDEPPNFATFAAALRAGNPEAIVAFNPGVMTPVIHYTEHEDYTAGEISDALPECPGPFVEGPTGHKDRYHILSYLGKFWGSGEPRFPDALVGGYTRHVVEKGGVVSWDVPISGDGVIPAAFRSQLKAIGQYVGK